MGRKLYALFILVWTLWAIILTYLYFFVYYTATLTIDANLWEYSVELFSKSTAQKWQHDCPEAKCIIRDVSPFDYNMTLRKEGYEDEFMSMEVSPRRNESIFFEFEKKVILKAVKIEEIQEATDQKIQRLREEKLYYARFQLGEEKLITFSEEGDRLVVQYNSTGDAIEIAKIPRAAKEEIKAEYIGDSDDIFIAVGEIYYIFEWTQNKLYELPYKIPVGYIKLANQKGVYLVVTEKWTFRYQLISGDSEYQYLFHDFVYAWDSLVWVVREGEEQKRQNFDLNQTGNLIIRYTPSDKIRKVLYESFDEIERIQIRWEKLILLIKDQEYELKNY